jgi:ELWxxDGT repeat protein
MLSEVQMLKQVAFFSGFDSNRLRNLWVSDGTPGGTTELTVTGENPNSMFPDYFAQLRNQVVFGGTDNTLVGPPQQQQYITGLWVSDGTDAGSHELSNISNADPIGVHPRSLTYFDGQILFAGIDSNFDLNLWSTDGTTLGTVEIGGLAGIDGSYFNGSQSHPGRVLFENYDNPDLVVFDGKVLMTATNASAVFGLWQYDGVAVTELSNIFGAYSQGLFYFVTQSSHATPDFTVFGNEVLFEGGNTSGLLGLWVTDGTAGGTHEITGISGTGQSIQPGGFTVFKNQVFFSGFDSSSQFGLWTTDGTAAGTHELTGIPGVPSIGLSPAGFTALGGMLVFSAYSNTSFDRGLWVTDGTSAGTHQLTNINGAATTNGGGGLNPTEFTPYGGELLFNGQDSAGNYGLWVTDGTAGGTHELTGINGANTTNGINPGYLTSAFLNVPPLTDFNNDPTSDLLFRNTGNGVFSEWQSTGGSFTPNVYVNSVNSPWQLQGTMDFNGDGNADLVWRNATSGTFTIWNSTGNGFTANSYVGGVDPAWSIEALADFNGDGMDDLLWQNGNTFAEWQSTGSGFAPNAYIGSVSSGWALTATGDFTGNGMHDLLWFNNSTNAFTVWDSTGPYFTPNVYVGSVSSGWRLAGIGDFGGNGMDDLVWFNSTTGAFTVWDSTGSSFAPNVYVGSVSAGWTLAGTGDYTGDGKDDLLWRNDTAATFTVWQSTGTGFTPNALVGSAGTDFSLAGNPTHTHTAL